MAWQAIVQAIKEGITDTANAVAQPIDSWANARVGKPSKVADDAKKDTKEANQNLANTGSKLVSDAVTKSSDTGTSGLGFQGSGIDNNGVGGGAGMKDSQDFLGSLSDANQKENVRGSVLKEWMKGK